MMLRAAKVLLVAGLGMFYSLVVLNNVTDYDSNYQFVRHVLMMDSTFPGNHLMWRAMNSPGIHTAFYLAIIFWESVTMVGCWMGAIRLFRAMRGRATEFHQAKKLTAIALSVGMLMWLVAFLCVGGEWFLMWQSKTWNGQETAFRMFCVTGMVLLVVMQRDDEMA